MADGPPSLGGAVEHGPLLSLPIELIWKIVESLEFKIARDLLAKLRLLSHQDPTLLPYEVPEVLCPRDDLRFRRGRSATIR
jgi:hypothetical protein